MSNLSKCSNLAVQGSEMAGTNENSTPPNCSGSVPTFTEAINPSSLYAYRINRYLVDSDHYVPHNSPSIIGDEPSSAEDTELRKEAIAVDLEDVLQSFVTSYETWKNVGFVVSYLSESLLCERDQDRHIDGSTEKA
ncbi:hypothetical protein EAF00_011405 [Botryotinia globosa]|nr:hypothetical protein EAF00_011405 [Botryotinia globosa]